MANENFYDELDLRYPEIGIALDDILRCNPGKIRFSVPILTPEKQQYPAKTDLVRQTNSNILNKNRSEVEVNNINSSNYITIEIPRELCALPHAKYKILNGIIKSPDVDYSGHGSVLCAGSCCGGANTIDIRNGNIHIKEKTTGYLDLHPYDDIIKAPSKWLICFIGGDINNPAVLCRLPGGTYLPFENGH